MADRLTLSVLLRRILAILAVMLGVTVMAAWLFAPYAAWVAFASALNAYIFALN